VAVFGTIHAGEPVMRITAFEEALDDTLFEPPLQAPLGSQLRQVASGRAQGACVNAAGRSLSTRSPAPSDDSGEVPPSMCCELTQEPVDPARVRIGLP
jgi:hypothetical protein